MRWALLLTIATWIPFLSVATAQERSPFPEAEARVKADVALLKAESAEETLEKLSAVGMYFWPGPGFESSANTLKFPIEARHAQRDVEHLLSNRRVLKAYQDLQPLDKAEASRLLERHLASALKEYERMFQREIDLNGPHFLAGAKIEGGPAFTIGNTDRPTIVGMKLKVLALVFLAGNLELTDVSASVGDVARRAVKQYDELSRTEKYHLVFRFELLRMAGLYSRQALATGLIGTAAHRDEPAVKRYRARLSTIDLPYFDARATPYDQAVIFGGIRVDYPAKPLRLSYFTALSDTEFEEIVAAAAFKER